MIRFLLKELMKQRLGALMLLLVMMLTMTAQTAWAEDVVTYTISHRTEDGRLIYYFNGSDGSSQVVYDTKSAKPTSVTLEMGSDVTFNITAKDGRVFTCDNTTKAEDISMFGFSDYFNTNYYAFTFTSKSRNISHIQIDGRGYVNFNKAKTTLEVDNSGKTCTVDWEGGSDGNRKGAPGKFIVTFAAPVTNYAINYVLNGGTNASGNPTTYADNVGVASFATPTRDGYTFAGWYGNASFTGSAVTNIPAGSSGNKTLYAKWTPAPAHFSQSGNTYTIHTAGGWNVFCDLLAENDKGYFSGKTVKLGNNITVSRMAGSSYHDFTGTFDGQGKTLTFSATAAENYCAPFRYVEGTSESHAVIRNLNVVTTITSVSYRHAAGLIALQGGYVDVTNCDAKGNINSTKGTDPELYPAALVSQASGGLLTVSGCTTSGTISIDGKYAGGMISIVKGSASVTDCRSSVTINSSTSGDGTHGGLVASQSSNTTINITGCVFDGRLLGSSTTSCGGFIGWRGGAAAVTNSLFAPAEVTVQNASSATFARNSADTYNSYYTYLLNDGTNYVPNLYDDTVSPAKWHNGKATRTVTAGGNVTIDAIALTGDATEYDVSGITAYSGGGLKRGDVKYYGSSDQVSLKLSHGDREGYTFDGYTASAGTLSGDANPYTLTMPDADVTINATLQKQLTHQDITVTIPSQTYTGSAIEPAVTVKDGETTLTLGTDYEVVYSNNINAGTATATITGKSNYSGETAATFNIDKATPYVKTAPTASAITYGQTLSVSELNGGVIQCSESIVAEVAGTFSWIDGTVKPSVADSEKTEYEVTFTPTDSENYKLVTTNVTLTVNKATTTVTAPIANTLIYDGSEQELVTAGSTDFGTLLYSLDGETYSEGIPTATNAGTYTVYYKVVADANHKDVAAATVKVTIARKAATVTADDKTKEYGAADPELTATVAGLVGEDKIAYTLTRAEGEDAGEYAITASGEAEQGNYSVTFVAGKLTINAKPEPETPEPNAEVVNPDEKVTVGGETFYEPKEETKEALKEHFDSDFALSVEATNRITVNSEGELEFKRGKNVNIAIPNKQQGDVVKFKFIGKMFGDSSKLRRKGGASTRSAGDMELISGAEYEVLETGSIVITVAAQEAPVTFKGISTTAAGATGIEAIDKEQQTADSWYDLNGQRLPSKPTKKGLYIHNGQKIVIK